MNATSLSALIMNAYYGWLQESGEQDTTPQDANRCTSSGTSVMDVTSFDATIMAAY